MSNPRVRPHLHFYPEDCGTLPLAKVRQAKHWLEELPNNLLTLMACIWDWDYYIHEPAMLVNTMVCMPFRWFTRFECHRQVLYAKCWRMQVITNENSSF